MPGRWLGGSGVEANQPRPGEWEAGTACKSLPKPSVRSGHPGSEGSNMCKSPSTRKRAPGPLPDRGERNPADPSGGEEYRAEAGPGGWRAGVPRPGGRGRESLPRGDLAPAYYLWLGRGRPIGTDWDDWLEAERQLAASA